jgi:hypothetical protein
MTKKNHEHGNILPEQQRKVAKMGRMASGAGKTMKSTSNAKHNNYRVRG